MALTGANLISYWSLEEASGSRADAHTGGNTLTDNNTVTQQTGKIANCAQFAAASFEYLSHADNASLSTGDIDFCFAAWIYMDTLSNRTIGGKYGTTGNQREWVVYYNHTDHVPNARFSFVVSSNGTAVVTLDATTFGAPSAATWYFVVIYHDAANNLIGISINDTLNTASYSSGVFDGTAAFQLGMIEASIYPMNGRIDEAAFWKAVPTAADITALYNSGSGRDYAFVAAMGAAGHAKGKINNIPLSSKLRGLVS